MTDRRNRSVMLDNPNKFGVKLPIILLTAALKTTKFQRYIAATEPSNHKKLAT
jgi:hypothetical protein